MSKWSNQSNTQQVVEVGERNDCNVYIASLGYVANLGLIVFIANDSQEIPIRIGVTSAPPDVTRIARSDTISYHREPQW